MKKILLLLIVSAISFNVAAQEQKEVIRLSEPVKETKKVEIFGSVNEGERNPISLESAISLIETEKEKDVVITSEVSEVCQKKGCFFIATDGERTARVTFKDYSFFIPTDSNGKEATIFGTISKKKLTEEQAKHYAEDAGKDPDLIEGEQFEYSIVATSIILPKITKK